ncbi:protein disulfide-isomerase A2 [Varanus komodoensis]|uniref:protein disulfide-isomerase A2 n=1 Tax=Varanus komodoensis TaxID=61221 RepID=UPI001CF7C722|nr:protein disulfide-isomerase A2 [Varanus komodoensis]
MGWFPAARWLLLVGLAVALGQHTETWASMSVAEGEQEEQVSGEFVEEDEVLVLTQSNFAQALQKHPLLLVEFYAPWCRPCQALAPEYAKAAAVLKDEGSPVRLAKVDAVEERLLSAEFGATEYPVLKLFRDGNRTHPANFTGQQDAEGIVKWLKRKAGPSAVLLEDAEEAAAFLDAHTVAVVGFFSDLQDADVRLFYDVASDAPDAAFAVTNHPELFQMYNITSGSTVVSLFRKHDEPRADFLVDTELGLDVAELSRFVAVQSLELVMEFTKKNASRIFGAQVPNHLLLFLNKTVDSQLELLDSFRGAASAFRGKVLFVLADVDGEGAGVLHYFGLKSQDAPAIRFIHIETNTKYRLDTDELSAATVHTFCRDVLGGKVQPHLMSEEIPRDWDKQPVKVLVGKNFEQVAFDEAKSVFVKFYAPWCPHSKAMAPAWEELGQKYDGHPDIVIAQMDATANEVAGLPVPAYPTLYYFPAGDERKMVEYRSARDVESFVRFLEGEEEPPPPESSVAAEDPEGPKNTQSSPEASEPHAEL